MNSFRTEINITKSTFDINHQLKILTLGSCFSENIGSLLLQYKFNVLINPFGILYNPYSIKECISKTINNYLFKDSDIIYYQEQWHSFYHHGKFSKSTKEELLRNINLSVTETNKFIEDADYILITFGSAYIYKHIENNIIVSNCHKIPSKLFEQSMLDLEAIYNEWEELIKTLKDYNSKIKIIFTVSPIRYLKYGVEMNQLSKSTLILLINKLKSKFDNIGYFPSYEIFMDDLRDYRFYKSDMIHPSELAIEYIWGKFSECFFSKDTLQINKELNSVSNAMNHKPRNVKSEQHKIFLNSQLKKVELLENKYPFLNLEPEKKYFNN